MVIWRATLDEDGHYVYAIALSETQPADTWSSVKNSGNR